MRSRFLSLRDRVGKPTLVRGHLSLKSSAGNSHQAFQGGKLPRHPGKVASYVPCYVLRVLCPHSSTSLTPCATKASVRPPEPLPSSVGALPSPAPPRPSRWFLRPPGATPRRAAAWPWPAA